MKKVRKLNKRKFEKFFAIVVALVLFVSIYLNTYLLIKYNVLPLKYLIIYFGVVGIIPFILIFISIFKRPKLVIRIIIYFIEFLYLIILFVVFGYLNNTFNFLDNFTSNYDYETKNYYVLVNKESNYEKLEDLDNKNIGYSKTLDDSIEKAISELERKIKFNKNEIESYTDLFTKLESKEIDAVIIIDNIYETFIENDEALKNNNKIVKKIEIKEKTQDISKDVDVTEEPFNVYISGIDSYGSVNTKTRSDVNIVMSINPKTHKILMINIPRDYYVTLYGKNYKDKLTHAGNDGVETSVKTIENLLDISINYYIKVNYNAVIKLVDALDGVDVYSEYNFTSADYHYKFVKGYNHVNGKMALDFVRTRKAFLEGDRVRGENQQRMIQAIIDKALSPKILLTYNDILDALDGSFITNISTKKIMSLVNMQLDKMPKWDISSMSLNGKDGKALTPSSSIELYVMIPDEETIAEAKELLKANNENN